MGGPPAAFPPFFWPPTEGEPPGEPPSGVEVLGHDYGTFLVVSADGSVVSLRPEGEKFVNSSQDQFADSLALLRDAWSVRPELSDSEADAQAARLRADLTALDPAAVAGIDHWWSNILEQLEQGLL